MNELYRTGQVGQETTQANSQLQSERATGWETGATYTSPRNAIALSGTYFWTEINRPVSAVFLSSTATSITDKRQNLGQIVSQGTELHLDLRPGRAISATLGYQYAHAVGHPLLRHLGTHNISSATGFPRSRARASPRNSAPRAHASASSHSPPAPAATPATTAPTPSSSHAFFQLDLAARHDFGPHWTASAHASTTSSTSAPTSPALPS